ncbi:uncharacterized protein HGUI_00614 [Hanseniaspora guilliermondii]|uniref:WD repeat-containing protein n=1 Tax=Hanseniaspora guilliermondii TaxID=56406 RepID=A0A1L0FFR2_9ASCO|nr:uncharacterized protein HGUI_00614 [Hanseniaspora guilliermondii]
MSKYGSYEILSTLDFNDSTSGVYTNNIIANLTSIFTSTSKGNVYKIDSQGNKILVFDDINKNNIQNIKTLDENNICISYDNVIKIMDLRSNANVIEKNFKERVHSMDAFSNKLALGFELTGPDAPIRLFDMRKDFNKSQIDIIQSSHHDDITSLYIHRGDPNILLSGSVDGTCNLYDLSKYNDEILDEEVLEEVITLDSVHKCKFINKINKRIGILTHTEQFGTYNVMSESEDKIMYGDLREPMGCKYIIDFDDDFVYGGNIDESKMSIYSYTTKGKLKKNIDIVGIHGNEVIRDFKLVNDIMYTCGEDGKVNVIKMNIDEKDALKKSNKMKGGLKTKKKHKSESKYTPL